ncbi:hypothetical protein SAMN02745247_02342 [Butyrivibrio hungatei DSM 14810]|uniref:DUF961 domain-containing protein n=1 Tax=Butyrivibrio hungatei DSM 14810 TaxID=1121132 RepID=A0A1M7SS41_9FIRM|nr:hypothetical protein [Butyrivibrio hungatei]SHN61302.1 hypothetical protein SAMN02745247_02342 [Butyrivibrio hungatei DSM 14810]
MSLSLNGYEFPLDTVLQGAELVLRGADKLYEYRDGVRTDNQLGMKFTLVEQFDFEKFVVKVPGLLDSPIPLEKIQDKSKKIYVSLKDAKIKQYYDVVTKRPETTVTASAIQEVKQSPRA